MKYFNLLVYGLILILPSCDNRVDIISPSFSDRSILEDTAPLPDSIKARLEGVYSVTHGNNKFGADVVLKWNRGKLSILGSKRGIYFIYDSGEKDSTLLFEGKWRFAIGTETGLARLSVDAMSGIENIFSNSLEEGAFRLKGFFGRGNDKTDIPLEFEFKRPFSQKVQNTNFYIIAHRGGGRNSDYVGASENSIEIVPYAEYFGANGIEIDVKLSKDNVPFLYHDTNINLRLTAVSPLWGPIEKFTFAQLRSFVRLINGERIPTLSEMLEYVLEETQLEFVWLDMKSEKNAMPFVIPIQQEILNRAAQIGRNLEIAIGLPTEFARDNFLNYPDFENISSLCELDLSDVRNTNSHVWAPRWTLGTQLTETRIMHNEGRRVFTWTLDETEFISEFLEQGEFDGFLTNYPSIVTYYHYAQ